MNLDEGDVWTLTQVYGEFALQYATYENFDTVVEELDVEVGSTENKYEAAQELARREDVINYFKTTAQKEFLEGLLVSLNTNYRIHQDEYDKEALQLFTNGFDGADETLAQLLYFNTEPLADGIRPYLDRLRSTSRTVLEHLDEMEDLFHKEIEYCVTYLYFEQVGMYIQQTEKERFNKLVESVTGKQQFSIAELAEEYRTELSLPIALFHPQSVMDAVTENQVYRVTETVADAFVYTQTTDITDRLQVASNWIQRAEQPIEIEEEEVELVGFDYPYVAYFATQGFDDEITEEQRQEIFNDL